MELEDASRSRRAEIVANTARNVVNIWEYLCRIEISSPKSFGRISKGAVIRNPAFCATFRSPAAESQHSRDSPSAHSILVPHALQQWMWPPAPNKMRERVETLGHRSRSFVTRVGFFGGAKRTAIHIKSANRFR